MHTGSPQGFWRWSVQGRWYQRRRPVRLGWQRWSTVIMALLCGLSVASVLGLWTTGHAQESLGIAPGRRLRPEPLPSLEERPPPAPPRQVLPPLPPPPPGAPEQLPQVRVFVQQINVVDSTVFSADELAQVTAPYINREVTTEDLEELRLALTRLYVDRGYINSGAVIPDQTVQDGVMTFQIIEGSLSTIEITGNRWFRSSYVRRRVALGVTTPLNLLSLQERLQFLQQDDRIERFQAELKPGVRRGDSMLTVAVDEALPFAIALVFNNYQSPTVGAENGSITLAHRNLTGHGDILSGAYARSEGIDVDLDASYTLPLTVYDTTVQLQYQRTEFAVIEEPFTALDIESTSEIYGMILRHPFYRTLRQEFALALSAEHLHNATSLLGIPFDFSPGAENGESTVFALRLTMEWTNRTPNQVLAARSRFSVGLDAFDATIHDSRAIPDGEFFAWLGQFQWARRVTDWGLQVIGRLDVQLSTDPLLSLEQIAVGGRYSVRGYRENELVRDNAVIASLEGQVPLVRNKPWADVLQLAPFVDVGNAWNTKVSTPDPRTLVSVGIGLRWALTLTRPFRWQPSLEIYWGYPFEDIEPEGNDLQDLGLHFQVAVTGF